MILPSLVAMEACNGVLVVLGARGRVRGRTQVSAQSGGDCSSDKSQSFLELCTSPLQMELVVYWA